MASKLHNFFQQGKKIGGAGASFSCAAFEKDGHFCRHSETTVILSFAKNHHKGENKGDLLPDFARSFRNDGHNHSDVKFICRVSRNLFQPTV